MANFLSNIWSAFKTGYLYNIPVIGQVLKLFDTGKSLFGKEDGSTSVANDVSNFVGSAWNTGKTGNPLVDSYIANTFQSDATGRDVALNNMNKQNLHDQWALNVSGMQDAGINPALMYGSSPTGSAPSLSNGGAGGLSDLLALATLPAQIKLLNAQAEKTTTEAGYIHQKTLTEEQITRIQQIAAQFGVEVKEAEIQNIWSRTFNLTRDSNLKLANENYINSQTAAQNIINQNLPEKLKSEINSNNAAAQASAASAVFTSIQAEYANQHKCLMSSSDFVLIATYLGNLFHTSPETLVDKFMDYVKSDEFKMDMNPWKKVDPEDAFAWYLEHSNSK